MTLRHRGSAASPHLTPPHLTPPHLSGLTLGHKAGGAERARGPPGPTLTRRPRPLTPSPHPHSPPSTPSIRPLTALHTRIPSTHPPQVCLATLGPREHHTPSAHSLRTFTPSYPPQVCLATLGPGAYFGERALIKNQVRYAGIRADTARLHTKSISRADFEDVIGPLANLIPDKYALDKGELKKALGKIDLFGRVSISP